MDGWWAPTVAKFTDVDGLGYRLVHVGDTENPAPAPGPACPAAVGFVDGDCAVLGRNQRFHPRKPR